MGSEPMTTTTIGQHKWTHPWPCRVSETERVIHCNSCEGTPKLLARIDDLERRVQAAEADARFYARRLRESGIDPNAGLC